MFSLTNTLAFPYNRVNRLDVLATKGVVFYPEARMSTVKNISHTPNKHQATAQPIRRIVCPVCHISQPDIRQTKCQSCGRLLPARPGVVTAPVPSKRWFGGIAPSR